MNVAFRFIHLINVVVLKRMDVSKKKEKTVTKRLSKNARRKLRSGIKLRKQPSNSEGDQDIDMAAQEEPEK